MKGRDGMPDLQRGLTRRLALARAGAAVAVGTVLSACGTKAGQAGASSAAVPQPKAGAIPLVFQANNQGVPWNPTTRNLYQSFVDETFNANTPGVWATVFPGGWGNPQSQIVASLAGSGYADIFHGCCDDIATMQSAGWLVALDAYLRRDNVPISLWSPGHIAGLTFNGQLFGIPSYDGPAVFAYRQDILDSLGLPYPDETWTSQSAAQLWQQCTGMDSKGHKRIGADIFWDDAAGTWQFWAKGWGGDVMNPAHDTCLADSPQFAAACGYLAGLHTAGVVQSGSGVGDLVSGRAVFSMCGGWEVFNEATQLGSKFKWDLLPVPLWPKGRSTFGNVDFYAMNRVTKNPDAAWSLLHWLTAEPDWQRFQMKSTMVQPCLLSLWDEWEAVVKAVAPTLDSKALHWYKDAALSYSWATLHFAYSAAQANSTADNWLGQIWNGKISPQLGVQQLQQQVNAVEQAGKAEVAQGASKAKAFPTEGPDMAVVPAGM